MYTGNVSPVHEVPVRIAHKLGVILVAVALMLALLLVPRHGQGQDTNDRDFGDYVVHVSAIPTNQLLADVARQYGVERSARRGLLNVSVERKSAQTTHTVSADIVAEMRDLSGHRQAVPVRETSENGDIDYLGEFPLTGSGTYLFTLRITPPGRAQPYVVTFNQDCVVD
jgi:Domain of unknown function (DUF4426)